MIIMPAWIISESEIEYVALLGSEPKMDAKREVLPKDCVKNIVYAPMIHESGHKFALLTLDPDKVPEFIKEMLNDKR
jgi:hypothetical protein